MHAHTPVGQHTVARVGSYTTLIEIQYMYIDVANDNDVGLCVCITTKVTVAHCDGLCVPPREPTGEHMSNREGGGVTIVCVVAARCDEQLCAMWSHPFDRRLHVLS